MSDFSENIVNQAFCKIYKHLKETEKIRSKSDIATQMGTYNHVVNSILKGKRNVTLEQLNRLIEIYNINANFLFGRTEEMFVGPAGQELPSLNLAEKIYGGRNNITLVPQKAMAGYAVSVDNPEFPKFMEQFKRFSVPGIEGQLIAFEVSGDSMLPNITAGDVVICESMERGSILKDNGIYVIVRDDIVVKRVQQIKEDHQLKGLRLISDNATFYPPYEVELEEIKQILKVKCRLTRHGMA